MTDFAPLSTARRWALGSGDKPPASLGRFELKKQLGRGAQATVWLALDPRLQRKAAIKLMRPMQDQDPSVLEQWLREARHLGRLAHPYIVPVFEADVLGARSVDTIMPVVPRTCSRTSTPRCLKMSVAAGLSLSAIRTRGMGISLRIRGRRPRLHAVYGREVARTREGP